MAMTETIGSPHTTSVPDVGGGSSSASTPPAALNPGDPSAQQATLRNVWKSYRAYANTSRRLKTEQGQWRRWLLIGTIAALLLSPFAKTVASLGWPAIANIMTILATVLFALMAWLHQEVLGENSEQSWVRSRQAGEGLKALAFRFLGGLPPFDVPARALHQSQAIAAKAGLAPDTVNQEEAEERLPPAPLPIEGYIKLRVDDQIGFYEKSIARARIDSNRITAVGRVIAAATCVFGVLGAFIAKDWRDIWAPALGTAATMATAQTARARHRFIIESYSNATRKLELAKTTWEISSKTPADQRKLVETVETILGDENAGWVQQMLLTPVVPDQAPPAGAGGP